ncbi:hypothetical protein FRC07_008660 [Ceratobasidium sp. 392]|nr:hypothetical protein FRC07_008660 [Ceratobasidium sp. 392]
MATEFSLSLEDQKLDILPQFNAVLAAARKLIEDVPSWRPGRAYGDVKTSSKQANGSGPSWFARISLHPPTHGTFDDFWNCLGVNHSAHEQEYIPEMQSATLLGSFGAFEAWSLGYKFTPPISNRTFTILIASVLEDVVPRQGYVISLPLNVFADGELRAKEPQGVRGRYVSVERVKEVDGQVEWAMATMSNPGGRIPIFLSDSQMPSKISQDVPHVLAWLKSKRGGHE